MSARPRLTIDDSLIDGLPCAVCGASALQVVHVKDYPDYVTCGSCKSAFVVEDGGERVMYGSLPAGYIETHKLAVRQWAWYDDVERSAEPERPEPPRPAIPASVPIPTLPEPPSPPERPVALAAAEPEPPPRPASAAPPGPAAPPQRSPHDRMAALTAAEPPLQAAAPLPKLPTAPPAEPLPPAIRPAEVPKSQAAAPARLDAVPPPPAKPPSEKPAAKPAAAAAPPASPGGPGEPSPGERYRVVAKGANVTIPLRVCAHCLRSPAPKRLAIVGMVQQGQGFTRARPTTFQVPLCAACFTRSRKRGEDESNARLQAHLISALVALVVLVGGLALDLIDLQSQPLIGLFLVILFLAVGYSFPAVLLLGRTGRFPLPRDAVFVRTTLRIAEEIQGTDVPFEWRNRSYAEIFHQANTDRTIGAVTKVKDRADEPEAAAGSAPPPRR